MNENLNLVEILKNCPIGTEFYHSIYNKVYFVCIDLDDSDYPIRFSLHTDDLPNVSITKNGKHLKHFDGDCVLFPSKDQRDWSKFTAPWYKKEKIGPRFNVGDWVVDNCGYVWKIEGILNQFYLLEGVEGGEPRPTIDLVDKTFHLWTIQDAKDGDILACNEEILLYKSYSVLQGRISLYCWYNGHTNNFHSKEVNDILLTTRNKVCPATKEQCDVLMKAMNDAGYKWDADKKELNKKDRFDPKTLQPFDKVLIRRSSENYNVWFPDFVSDPPNGTNNKTLCMCVMEDIAMVIPYNDETKHLLGTSDEAPEYYRYWED